MTGGGGGLLAPPHSGSSGSVHITEEYGRRPGMTGFAPRTRGRISPHTAHQTSSHVGIAGFRDDDSSSKSAQPPNGPPRILIPGVPPCPQTVRRLVLQTAGREDSAARTPEIVRHPAPGPDRFFHPPMQIRRTRRRFPRIRQLLEVLRTRRFDPVAPNLEKAPRTSGPHPVESTGGRITAPAARDRPACCPA